MTKPELGGSWGVTAGVQLETVANFCLRLRFGVLPATPFTVKVIRRCPEEEKP